MAVQRSSGLSSPGLATGSAALKSVRPGRSRGVAPDTETADVLAYLIDMIAGLHEMARRTDSPTLAGLLVLAQSEARLQHERVRLRAGR